MTSTNGPSIFTEIIPLQTNSEFEQLTREEMYMQNRCLKETLSVTLELKRILEHIFTDPEVVKSGVVNKYKPHAWKSFKRLRAYRIGFSEHLVKTIENLDSTRLTKCFTDDCKLPDCKRIFHKPKLSLDEFKLLKMNQPTNGLEVQPKNSDNTRSNTSRKQTVTSINAEEKVVASVSPIQEKVTESESKTNGENDATDNNDHNAIKEDHEVSKADSLKDAVSNVELSEIIEEEETANSGGVSTDAPTADTPTDAENDVLLNDNDNEKVNAEVTINNTDDDCTTSSEQTDCGPPPTKRLRISVKDGSTEERSNAGENNEEQFLVQDNNATAEVAVLQEDNANEEYGEDQFDADLNEQEALDEDNGDNVSGRQVYNCKAKGCDKTFTSLSETAKHYETHTTVFKCSQCPELYLDKENLYRHFLTHNLP